MKNIKRFLLINVLGILLIGQINACGLYRTNNHYMIFVAPTSYNLDDKMEQINSFWSKYTNGKYNEYTEEIIDYAKSKKDNEMVEYLNYLNVYLYGANSYSDTWDYPTKEDVANYKLIVKKAIKASLNYKGERLKSQYALLYVRLNIEEENYKNIISFWNNKAKRLPNSVYKTMIENYYAGALYNMGRSDEALEIFYKNKDFLSIKWVVREHRNIVGLKKIYNNNPNSKALYYLVQDYVNHIQDSFDEICECIEYDRMEKSEVKEFLAFVNTVIKEKKVKDLCFWNTARAMMEYILGNNSKAKEYINLALNYDSEDIVKENARCVKLLIYTSEKNLDEEYIYNEFKWLDNKIKTDKLYGQCFLDAKEKIMMHSLVPNYRKQKNTSMVLSLFMINSYMQFQKDSIYYEDAQYLLTNYSEYFSELQQVTPEAIINYKSFLNTKNTNAFQEYIREQVKFENNDLNDLIGTKYISQGEFDKAISYLEKVPMSFVNNQSIAYYMQRRDYTKELWFYNQYLDELWDDMEKTQTMKSNPKISFCKEMIKLIQQFNSEKDAEKRYNLAYLLATRYYQASYVGQCWFLTEYYYSSATEGARDWQVDFYKQAEKYLNIAKNSKNQSLKTKSLYALAYIPRDSWAEYRYDWENGGYIFQEANRHSQKYKRLNNLFAYLQQNPKSQTDYTRKCDVLKQFAKYK